MKISAREYLEKKIGKVNLAHPATGLDYEDIINLIHNYHHQNKSEFQSNEKTKNKTMKKFNINDHMYIQITPEGWAHLKNTVGDDYIKNCIDIRKVIIKNEIWYRLQCHNVFDLFPVNIGMRSLFDTNVMFDDDDLIDFKCIYTTK